MKKIILNNRLITIREVADDVGILFGSCQPIFMDVFDKKRAAAKIVPNCQILCKNNDDPYLLKKVITSDESWVYGYDIETKAQSSQWQRPEEPRPKKARQIR